MPYNENSQLPEAVRNSLSESDQSKWRDIFNAAYESTCDNNDACASKVAWSQMKKAARYFSGWASAEVIDRQGDVVEMGAFEKTMDLFMHLGSSIIDQHSNRKVGQYYNYEFKNKVCEDGVERPGVLMHGVIYKGQRIHDDVWQKIQTGEYSGLSIGADPLESRKECNAKTCWNAIKNIDLFEISVVETPANQESLIVDFNSLAKSNTIIGETMAEEPNTIKKAVAEGTPATAPDISKSDEIMAMLKGMDERMTALESGLAKAEDMPDEEKPDEEEDMEEKSAAPSPDIEAVVEKAIAKAFAKRLASKEPDTPRPSLNKNDLQKSKIADLIGDSQKLAKMSIKEIDAMVEQGSEAKPW